MGKSNYAEADVLIEGDIIAEVGPGLRARDAELVDATDTIVMPGFVDTHRHVWRSLFRNLGDASADPGPQFGAEDVYAATLIGLLQAADAGITTVADWSDPYPDGRMAEAALEAHVDSGIRTVLVVPGIEAFGRLHQSLGAGATTVAYGASPGGSAEGWAVARRLGARVHIHVGMARDRAREVAALGDLLGSDATLIHCTHIDDEGMDAIAGAGAKVIFAPSTEMANGIGSAPIQKVIDRKIRPGLGIGDERVGPGDMFAQMRATISLQHATYFELKLAGKAGLPNLLTTREVIRFGTIDGANAIGMGDAIGSLAPGKKADLIVLRTDKPNVFPINDPIGAVVWGMDTSNVDWVFVAGQAVKREGKLQGDAARAGELALAARERVVAAGDALASVAAGGAV